LEDQGFTVGRKKNLGVYIECLYAAGSPSHRAAGFILFHRRRRLGFVFDKTLTMPATRTRKPKSPKATRIATPGYGFPKGTKGLLPWSWAEQRLKKSHNYWIVTVKPDGSPHAMVVWGMWQDGRFLFSTGSQSRKARNLAANANCIVCTENAAEAVIVEGIAEIADVAARRKMIPAYERKYDWDLSSMQDDLLSMKEPVFAVRPKVVFGLWERHFQQKSTRWKFE